MNTVSILPIPDDQGGCSYEAISGNRHGAGPTPGTALDAIAPQMSGEVGSTLVLIQSQQPDQFFTAQQMARLQQLMAQWKAGRAAGGTLTADQQRELEDLVQLEVMAAGGRANQLAQELGR